MRISVKYFGMIAEKTNCESEELQFDQSMTVQEFHEILQGRYGVLLQADYKLSYNQKISSGSEVIEDGGEIALLPPFAGG